MIINLKKRFIFLLLITSYLSINAQNRVLRIEMKGKSYDSLFIDDIREIPNRYRIDGVKQNADTWLFTIPDSVYNSLPDFEIRHSTFDFKTNTSSRIRFVSPQNGDSCFTNRLNFQDGEQSITAKYNKTAVFDDLIFSVQLPNKEYKSNVPGKMIMDYFTINCDSTSDIYIRTLEPYFSLFLDVKNKGYDYNGFLEHYSRLAKKYPTSRYLMINLSSNVDQYRSTQDVDYLYNILSNRHKRTVFGENIEKYLNNRFINTLLYNQQGTLEPIIKDSTTYNLIVFSASWCGPCHKQIPILKELYQNLKGKLEITYVSIDLPETTQNWITLMEKEQIPWRSLLAKDKKTFIEDNYFFRAIPHTILVLPSMQKMIIDVRKSEDRKKLNDLLSRY